MIRITIKVSNDHCSLVEHFEETYFFMCAEDPKFKQLVDSVIDKFDQPVDDVVVKARYEV